MVAEEVGDEHRRMEERFEQSGRDKERDGGWPKGRNRLDRKYGMIERGALAVSTLLKNKIQSASTKIKWHVGKCVARRQNNLFKNKMQLRLGSSGAGNGMSTRSTTGMQAGL